MAVTPIMIDLKGKDVVVVGGGNVAERKINNLLDSEANITVVSPSLTVHLLTLHEQKKIDWKQKEFSPSDLDGTFLVISAVNNTAVNKEVIAAAPQECLLNAASNAALGNIHFPAHVKRGKLSIAISTNGASPVLAKRIKQDLQSKYDERYEAYLDFLFEARQILKQINLSRQKKEEYLHDFLSDTYLNEKMQKQALRSLRSYINHFSETE